MKMDNLRERLAYDDTMLSFLLSETQGSESEEFFEMMLKASDGMWESVDNYLNNKYTEGQIAIAYTFISDYSEKLQGLSRLIVEELKGGEV